MELEENDRDVTRFLWLKDIKKPFADDNIIELRFCRVIWGIICAAFLLGNTINHHLSKYKDEIAKNIKRNLYVDNLLTGSNNRRNAIIYYQETKKIFNEAGMNMRKWISNDDEVMKNIKHEDQCPDKKVKVLGIMWDVESDSLTLATHKVPHTQLFITKRNIVQAIASVFDPTGTRCPVLLQSKILLQELWEQSFGWDDVIPETVNKRWSKCQEEIQKIHTIRTPRCINTIPDNGRKEYHLITFTDASKYAYSAAVYLKVTNGASTDVNLLFAKTRLCPVKKKLTIPRLELMGVLIGCRMSEYIRNQVDLNIATQTLYTDSKCVLEWIKSTKSMKRFVMARINEIKGFKEIGVKYVKSEENPADVATRGCRVDELSKKEFWWKGPSWVSSSFENTHEVKYELNEEIRAILSEEAISTQNEREIGLMAESDVKNSGPFGIDEKRYSQFHRLIRITAWCHRFICNIRNPDKGSRIVGYLSAKELLQSSQMWTKHIQETNFNAVLHAVRNKKSHNLSGLGLYRDKDGVLRCPGRFQASETRPRLLPKNGHFTELVIGKFHKLCLHGGVAHTLSYIRQEFWIIQARSSVRKQIRKCLTCIRWQGGSFRTPDFSPYPDYVTNGYGQPYSYAGLDYLGPIGAYNSADESKCWIILFTCINTRAIHLELVFDMTTNEFLLAMRRFVSRRGSPKFMISDNGSQIKLANDILDKLWKKIVKDEEVLSYISEKAIQWKFITEYSPWKGGFYERLVGLTKNTLRKTLGRSKLTQTQMLTMIMETEAVINSRPLLYVDNDIKSGHCITPADFTSLNSKIGFPDMSDDDDQEFGENSTYMEILQSWKFGNRILNNFWRIWVLEYLPALTQRKMLANKRQKGVLDRSPSIGEIVIIKEDNQPRGRWKMGKVVELIKGEVDGVERAAKLIIAGNKFLKRPLCHLYPLECGLGEIDEPLKVKNDTLQNGARLRNIPRRIAAINARHRILDQAE